jgi:hypothetical protein
MSSLRSARPTAPGSPGRSSTPKAAFAVEAQLSRPVSERRRWSTPGVP